MGQLNQAIESGKKVGVSIHGETVKNMREGTRQEVIKHWEEPNPYQSRYGDEWERVLKGCSAMSSTVCITELVEHIVAECVESRSSLFCENTSISNEHIRQGT